MQYRVDWKRLYDRIMSDLGKFDMSYWGHSATRIQYYIREIGVGFLDECGTSCCLLGHLKIMALEDGVEFPCHIKHSMDFLRFFMDEDDPGFEEFRDICYEASEDEALDYLERKAGIV